jgi:hypothetical protein
MNKILVLGIVLAAWASIFATEASAVVCARGARGAACVGPRGVVAGRRAYIPRRRAVAVRGPRGTAVIRRGF